MADKAAKVKKTKTDFPRPEIPTPDEEMMDGEIVQYREQIQRLRLIDDDFMNLCFTDARCVELVLRIVLNKPDLTVEKVQIQTLLKGSQRSIWLDIYAKDSEGRRYDIEIQRSRRGANPRRARFHSALLDAKSLKSRQSFNALRENYVIFITETDVLGMGMPIYYIDRYINGVQPFGDGSHIIYVNGAMRMEETELGKLMHDFFCANPDEMHYSILADRTRYFKEDEEGIREMGSIMKEMMREMMKEVRLEGKREGRLEGEARGKKQGKLEGILTTLSALVQKGLLTLKDAAEQAGMSEKKFLAQVQALQ